MAASNIGKLISIPAGLKCTFVVVYAAAKEEELKTQLVKPEQLPIYTPPPLQYKYVKEQPGHLQMGFTSIRSTTGCYLGWCKSVYIFVKSRILDTAKFGKDAYDYLKNPPQDFLPKTGVITVSGLAGLILARKGSRFKKIAYSLGLATLGTTVCYPAQSVIIAKVSGKRAYDISQQIYESAQSLWTKKTRNESLLEHQDKTKIESSAEMKMPAKIIHDRKHPELSSKTKTKPETTSGSAKFMPDSKLMDHGQSYPEDVDMYSTRQ